MRLTYSIADQSFVQTKSIGILRVSLGLMRELAVRPEVTRLAVLANGTLAEDLQLPQPVEVEMHDEAIRGRLSRVWWDQRGVYGAAQRLGNDWLLLPKGYASGLGPCPVKLAVYVHDVMVDYYHRHHRGEVSFAENAYFRWAFRCSLRHARVIVTGSAFSAGEIARVAAESGLRTPPIRTVGVGFAMGKKPADTSRTAVLVLASVLPHKRTDLAVKYLERWQALSKFTGPVHWVGRFPEGLTRPSIPNWIYHVRLPDAEYERLVQEAQVVVYFSEYEGFGMPPVEAALAGACPVYSGIGATREVMAGIGCPFANEDGESFFRAMEAALRTPAAQVQEWAEALVRRHNWQDVAARTLRALEGAC